MSEDLVKVEICYPIPSKDSAGKKYADLPKEQVGQWCIWLVNGRCVLNDIRDRGSVECIVGGLDCEPAVPSFRVPTEKQVELIKQN